MFDLFVQFLFLSIFVFLLYFRFKLSLKKY